MKKITTVLLSLVLIVGLLAACGGNNEPANNNTSSPVTYNDGTYTAEGEYSENSGWKDVVDVTITDGKIAAVKWNAVHKDGGDDKITQSASGEYGMVEFSDAQAEWHEQAELAEQFLIEHQDLSAFQVKNDGNTDAVSGVSITVSGFVELVEEALAQAK